MKKGWLWPGYRLSHAIKEAGLGKEVDPCLRRTIAIGKSSLSKAGERPTPQAHFETCEVETSLLVKPIKITLVDDVITRGSMMLASYALVKRAFPEIEINCFAAVRTVSDGEIAELAKPVEGIVSFHGQTLRRQP